MVDEFSTNTNLLAFNKEHIDRDMDELVRVYASHGIKNLDLNFCEMMRPSSRLNDKRAEDYIKTLGEIKEELGLNYVQAHAPYPVRGTKPSDWDGKIINERFIKESDIIIAIENMESPEEISEAEEINEIIKSNPKRLKALLDTGHAHMRALDIKKEILTYGENLVGLHIHDNDGKSDQHLFPLMGTINWKDVIEGLSEIGYKGYFTYETMYYSREKSIKDEDDVIDKAIDSFHHLF